jgi:hypothetical protein
METPDEPAATGGLIFDLVERGFLLLLGVSAMVRLAPALMQHPYVGLAGYHSRSASR